MSIFLELISSDDKQSELITAIKEINSGRVNKKVYVVDSKLFSAIPGSPFSYWVTDKVRNIFATNSRLESEHNTAKQGLSTADDFRFVRLWWELSEQSHGFFPFAKGGAFAELYSDIYLSVYWGENGEQIKAWANTLYNNSHWSRIIKNTGFYFCEGLTWARRTQNLSVKILPKNCIFADKGPTIFNKDSDATELVAMCTVMNSHAFRELVATRLNAADTTARSFEVGIIQNTPMPMLDQKNKEILCNIGLKIINIKKQLDSVVENSREFYLPAIMQSNLGCRNSLELEKELEELVNEKEHLCAKLYSFETSELSNFDDFDPIGEVRSLSEDKDTDAYFISWAIGSVFGRYTLPNTVKPEINSNPNELFIPLDYKSRGMTMNSYSHSSPRCLDSVKLSKEITNIAKSNGVSIDFDVPNWVTNKFFDQHLKQYSKGRRQAPIYWPLQSRNASCQLWIYYHHLDTQSILSCVNDFVEPQLDEITTELFTLRLETSRSSVDEKRIDKLTDIKLELEDFRDELLLLSKFWQPNLNDSVQITAAPLWRLFQHKAWQKKLKDTWEKLQDGDYDWAHLAYTTWPERVLKKCHADRSLAIAHDVENELWHEIEVIKAKKKEPVWEWQSKPLSDAELYSYIKDKIATDDRLKLYRSNNTNANGGAL